MAKIMSVLRATFQFNAQNYAGTILSIWFSVRLWSSTVADCCIKTSPEGVENLDNSGTRVWFEKFPKTCRCYGVHFSFVHVLLPRGNQLDVLLPLFQKQFFLLYRSFYFGLFNLNGLGPNFIAVALVMVVMLQTHKSFNGYLRIFLNAAKSFFSSWWQFW